MPWPSCSTRGPSGTSTRSGSGAGWRCLESEPAAHRSPRFLADRVGPTGRVLATHIDTVLAARTEQTAPYDVLQHVIGTRTVAGQRFRPGPRAAGARPRARTRPGRTSAWSSAPPRRLAAARGRRPGLPAAALPGRVGPEQELANRLRHGFRTLLAQRGAELGYGRTLPRVLRTAGLLDVGPMRLPGRLTGLHRARARHGRADPLPLGDRRYRDRRRDRRAPGQCPARRHGPGHRTTDRAGVPRRPPRARVSRVTSRPSASPRATTTARRRALRPAEPDAAPG